MRSCVRRLRSCASSSVASDGPSKVDKDLSSQALEIVADEHVVANSQEWPAAPWLTDDIISRAVSNVKASSVLSPKFLGPKYKGQWPGGNQVMYWHWQVPSSTNGSRDWTVRIWASVEWHDPNSDDLRTCCACTCPAYRGLMTRGTYCMHTGAVLQTDPKSPAPDGTEPDSNGSRSQPVATEVADSLASFGKVCSWGTDDN